MISACVDLFTVFWKLVDPSLAWPDHHFYRALLLAVYTAYDKRTR